MHESQSRLFENHHACSAEFWHALAPALAREFPSLARADADELVLAANRSNPCANRQTADELTYPLHIVVRYELERAVFDGTLPVADLEDAWRATYEEYLVATPADARESVLQDVQWASGYVGYFPSYVLGDMHAAQIFDALFADVPDALARLGEGDSPACAGGSASTCGAVARPTPRRRPCASRRAPTWTWSTTSPTCAGASAGREGWRCGGRGGWCPAAVSSPPSRDRRPPSHPARAWRRLECDKSYGRKCDSDG